ncbi:MAG: hypothetical protein ACXVLT_11100 [Flavisolibacter sp.]
MKTFQKVTATVALFALFASCQSGFYTKKALSKPETRKEVMSKIANDSSMSKEMMAAMMTGNNGMTMMHDGQKMAMPNHEAMMKMMKDNPAMMPDMMNTMMDMCKNDTAMMAGMCKTMMANPQMMDMMEKMKGKNMNMGKMNALDTTNAIGLKSDH